MTKIGPNQGVSCSYELDIYEHIPILDPKEFGINGLIFDPKAYFITSGDAICKTMFLIQELTAFAVSIQNVGPWRDAVDGAATNARLLLEYLVAARGPQIFLETEHVDHKLVLIPKDPRKREAV